jgi:hypothetical protein
VTTIDQVQSISDSEPNWLAELDEMDVAPRSSTCLPIKSGHPVSGGGISQFERRATDCAPAVQSPNWPLAVAAGNAERLIGTSNNRYDYKRADAGK